MNFVISFLVGTGLAFTVTAGGTHIINGGSKASVSKQQLYSYADD